MKIMRRVKIEKPAALPPRPQPQAKNLSGREGWSSEMDGEFVEEPVRPEENFAVSSEAKAKQRQLDRIAKKWDAECSQITLYEDGSTDMADGKWEVAGTLEGEIVEVQNPMLRNK